MKELSEQEALYKAAAYCSSSEHCLSEVSQKLSDWGIEQNTVKRILQYLTKERYIDENRYCRCFVNDKLQYNKWGRNKIAQALWQKKISQEMIDYYLKHIDNETYLNLLKEVITNKKKSTKAQNDYELNGKLIRFALSRGFEMEYIRQCLDSYNDEEKIAYRSY